MCDACGCAMTVREGAEPPRVVGAPFAPQPAAAHRESVVVLKNLLAANDRTAAHNRDHFDAHGVLAINLMSSPGAGKTTLLEQTIQRLRTRYQVAVIEGDLATENDANRIRRQGAPAVQITTGNACHLDAAMVHDALHALPLQGLDLLFIENVGNLVCPASFDLGQHLSVALLSTPEGDDKPEKYPVMFRSVDLVMLTKTDLLPHIPEFSVERAQESLQTIACEAPLMTLSSRDATTLDAWCDWLTQQLSHHREQLAARGAPALGAHEHHAHVADAGG